jgi:hypothetical protein
MSESRVAGLARKEAVRVFGKLRFNGAGRDMTGTNGSTR